MQLSKQLGRKNSILQNFRSRKVQSIQAFKLRKKKLSHHLKSFNKQNFDTQASFELTKSRFSKKKENQWFSQLKKGSNLQLSLSNDFYQSQIPDTTLNRDVLKQYTNLTQKKDELIPQKSLQVYRKISEKAKEKIKYNQFGDFSERKILMTYNQQRHLKSKGQKQGKKHYSLLNYLKKSKLSIQRIEQLSKPRSSSINLVGFCMQQQQQTDQYMSQTKKKNRSISANLKEKTNEIITQCRKLQKDRSISKCLRIFERFNKQVDDKLVKKSFGVKKLYSIASFN